MSDNNMSEKSLRGKVEELSRELNKAREMCKNSWELFHKALLASPDPVSITEIATGKYLDVNQNFIDEIEYTRDEIIGRTSLDLKIWYSEEERQRFIKEFNINGSIQDFETRYRKKSGRIGLVLMSARQIEFDNKKCVLAYSRRVTHYRQTENLYKLLADNISDVIWTMLPNGRFTYISPSVRKLVGYTPEEAIKLNSKDILTPESYNKIGILLNNLLYNDQNNIISNDSFQIELEQVCKDGSIVWTEVFATPVRDDNGQLKEILGMSRNIQARKTVEQKAKERLDTLESIFRSAPLGMGLLTDRKFMFVNNEFCNISGYPREDVIGRDSLFLYENREEYLKVGKNKYEEIKKNGIGEVKTRIIKQDGSPIDVIISSSAVDNNDWSKGIIFNMLDITSLKEAEKKLIMAKEKAEENDRLKTAFLETMSHELRTPLNAVVGFSNLIDDETSIESIREMNHYVYENGQKLVSIIESIFDVSLLESGTTELKISEFQVKDIFNEIDRLARSLTTIQGKENILTYYQPDRQNSELAVKSDKARLKQLLTNFIDNAIKYTDKGSVRYGYRMLNGHVEFFVSDTGIGIPHDKFDLIFDKFRQIDYTSTRTRGGVGLGLTINKELAKLLGGTISLDSKPGEGSSFYFRMPVEYSSFSKNKDSSLQGRVFLIVEDMESSYLYLDKILKDSGAETIKAENGSEAISIIEKGTHVDMVLMDIRLPDMDGYETTRKIKKLKPDLPVIAQTAYAMSNDRMEAIEAGCSTHISKPIRSDELKAAITRYLPAKSNLRIIV